MLYIIETTSATSKGLRADSIELRQSFTCTEHMENAILPHSYNFWTKKSKNDETLFPRLNLIHLASDKGGNLKENVYHKSTDCRRYLFFVW